MTLEKINKLQEELANCFSLWAAQKVKKICDEFSLNYNCNGGSYFCITPSTNLEFNLNDNENVDEEFENEEIRNFHKEYFEREYHIWRGTFWYEHANKEFTGDSSDKFNLL